MNERLKVLEEAMIALCITLRTANITDELGLEIIKQIREAQEKYPNHE